MLDASLPTKLRFRLLGEARLAIGDSGTDGFRVSTQKGMALLVYLAMNAGRAISRQVLADLLWGDRVDAQARQNLRQCLLTLRRDLEPAMSGVLLVDDQTIALRAEAIEVDAVAFAAAANAPDLAERQRCLTLPWGSFLDSFHTGAEVFDEWVAGERTRLDALALRTFAELADRFDAAGDGARAILALERLVAIDPAEEDRHRRLLSLEVRYRGADAALARAKTLVFELKRAVDAEPEPATRALIENIRRSATTELKAKEVGRQAIPSVAATEERASAVHGGTDGSKGHPPATGEGNDRAQQPESTSIRHWLRRQSVGRTAAGVAVTILAVGGLAFGLMRGHLLPQPDAASDVPNQQASWESPPLPSRPTADAAMGRRGGIVGIAVLPFTNLGEANDASSVLAEMMTDDLTNTLSRVSAFRVISRQTAKSFRGHVSDVAAVGAELGVRYLLIGRSDVREDRVRVNVELIDAGRRQRVWSGHFERTGPDRNAVHDEIVAGLGRELQIEVTQVESQRTSQHPDVHELIFKGWSAMAEAATTGVSALQQAEAHFAQALAREPDNPRALTGLGAFHVNMSAQLFAADPAPHRAKGEALLRDVIDRYPNMDEPYSYMGLLYVTTGRRSQAASWFERAIELNPSQANAHAQLGRVLASQGRPEEGLQHVLYAIRLSPRDPSMSYWLGFAGFAELESKHYAKAVEYLERALVLNPGQPRTTLTLVAAHALAGNMPEARTTLEQLQRRLPHLSHEKLIARFFGDGSKSPPPQLGEGLRLAMAPPPDPWASPRRPSGAGVMGPAGSLTPIAILPFTTYGDTAGTLQLTADMISDDLTNMLSRVSGLRVISRQTMRTYQGRPIDVAAIGSELGVRYVLEGSMRMRDAQVRVNVELIDASTRSPVWSARIERDHGDHHGVQDEIVGRIARELQFEMYQVESEARSADHDADALAYRGWAAMWNAFSQSNVETFRQAEAYFTQALARDPQHFPALVGLGAYHVNVGAQQIVADTKPHLARAGEILQEAIRRRPNHAGARFYMGLVHSARGNLPEALDSFERAVDFNPSMASAHAHIGHVLARMGRPDEGLEHLRYAMRLSPRDPNLSYWLQFAGNAELQLNHYPQAIDNYRRSTTMNPGYPRSLAGLAAAHALSGNLAEARVYADKLKEQWPDLTAEQLLTRFALQSKRGPSPLSEGLRRALSLESH